MAFDTSTRPLFAGSRTATSRKGVWIPPLAVVATAVVGGLATSDARSFYAALDKPDWAPPAAVFGPVWTLLYLLMAIAAVIVWRQAAQPARRLAMAVFFAQLVANAAWSWLFFGARLGAWAMAELVLLWLLVAANIFVFWRVKPLAGVLVAPTLAWVSFAGALNLSVWLRNPALLG
jgi:translocator protein